MIAALAAATLPFAPPLDHPLRYETIETRAGSGGPQRSTLEQEARFARDGDGYALTLRTLAFRTDAPATERESVAAVMRPTIGMPIAYRVSADGVVTGVIDGDANWAAFVAGLRAAAALPGAPAARRDVAATMAALSRRDRDAQLLESADDVVPRDRRGGADRHAERDRPQPGGAVLHVVEDLRVSPESGLVLRRRLTREVRRGGGGDPVPLGETEVRLVGF